MKYAVIFDGPATHTGDDIEALAAKVIAEDVAFPMMFMPVSNGDIVGYFFAEGNDFEPGGSDEPIAVMTLVTS